MDQLKIAIAQIGGPSKVALLLGVSAQAVCFWRDGKRKLPADHCAKIEAATGGLVTRKHLRPDDWFDIWPEMGGLPIQAPGYTGPERRDPARINPFPDLERRAQPEPPFAAKEAA